MQEYLTVPQVAALLDCTEAHVRKLVQFDRIPSVKVGRRRLFPGDELEEWIREGGAVVTRAELDEYYRKLKQEREGGDK